MRGTYICYTLDRQKSSSSFSGSFSNDLLWGFKGLHSQQPHRSLRTSLLCVHPEHTPELPHMMPRTSVRAAECVSPQEMYFTLCVRRVVSSVGSAVSVETEGGNFMKFTAHSTCTCISTHTHTHTCTCIYMYIDLHVYVYIVVPFQYGLLRTEESVLIRIVILHDYRHNHRGCSINKCNITLQWRNVNS